MNLVENKYKCCGCGMCVNICPKSAICLEYDENGFSYPKINESLCVNCGLCKNSCVFQKDESIKSREITQKVFAVVNKDDNILNNSASGGAFAALAKYIFSKNGYVCGCAWDNEMRPKHIIIDNMDDLYKIQGSKYVQSNMNDIYKDIKKLLLNDKYVLFSGTPCQCDALRSFLKKDYEKLYCAELICHGVPNDQYFHEFVDFLERKYNGKIVDMKFRDKKLGWGALLKITFHKKNNKQKILYLKPEECYYYFYFFYKGLFFRDSCYSCKYACGQRKSDFTIGDFWGASKFHTSIECEKGVSVLISSTEKGMSIIENLKEYIYLEESSFENVMQENGQITHPSKKDSDYDRLLSLYKKYGVDEFQKMYLKTHRKLVFLGKLKKIVPRKIKKVIINLFKYDC